jgi:hypothetical protein
MATGDVDADGYGDVATVLERTTGGNTIAVMFGPFSDEGAHDVQLVPVDPPHASLLKYVVDMVVVGGSLGPNRGAIVLAAPEYIVDDATGAVAVVRNTLLGHDVSSTTMLVDAEATSFATAIASCDLDGDGRDEVVVTAPSEAGGSVNAYRGLDGDFAPHSIRVLVGEEGDSMFGKKVVCTDVVGDSRADVLVAFDRQYPTRTSRTMALFSLTKWNPLLVSRWTFAHRTTGEWAMAAQAEKVIVGLPGAYSLDGLAWYVHVNLDEQNDTRLATFESIGNSSQTGAVIACSPNTIAVTASTFRQGGLTSGAVALYSVDDGELGLTTPNETATTLSSPYTAPTGSSTANSTSVGTTAGGAVADIASDGGSLNVGLFAGLGIGAILLLVILLLGVAFRLRQRRATATSLSPTTKAASSSRPRTRRATRGVSASHLDRSRSSSAIHAAPRVQAYGDTSLAGPGAGQYAQTSLYPAPTNL